MSTRRPKALKSPRKTRVYIETYGCTLNRADTDLISGLLQSKGYLITGSESSADVVIFNTCTVKSATENKTLYRLKNIRKPLVVAGCMAVNENKIRKTAPHASIVFPSSLKNIDKAVLAVLKKKPKTFSSSEFKHDIPRIFTAPILRIPIEDGCTGNCYFCQTKLARPILRSYPMKTIVRWVEEGIEKGAKEIQITGMDSGAYGLDLGTNLIELLQYVLSVEGDFKVRLGMINPQHVLKMEKQLLEIFKNEKMYKFLHIPVQTGSEKVCKDMNRPHKAKDFLEIVKSFRKKFPEMSIATDIIVGYPTETENDFQKTKKLLIKSELDVVNVSKFSVRDGTPAKLLKQIDTKIVKRRSVELTKLVKKLTSKRNKKFIGKVYQILITEKQRDYTGRNNNYKQVVVKDFKGKLGDSVKVKIKEANHGSLIAYLYK